MTEYCPTCGHRVTGYKYTLDDLDVLALKKVHQRSLDTGDYKIDIRTAGLGYAERSRITQLRFHGLLAKAKNDRGKHIPSTWILTNRAARFLKGKLSVPVYVLTKNNRVVGHAGEMVHKNDFRILDDFGPHWDFAAIGDDLAQVLPLKQLTLGVL